MKHTIKSFTVVLMLCVIVAQAQTSTNPPLRGYIPVSDVSSFQSQLSTANSNIKNISSDFEQVKEMTLLAEKINSFGKFYFQKENKVRIEYTRPYSYLLVMDDNRLVIKDEGKTSKINTRGSKMMQSVNRIMVDCMQGTVFDNPDFKVSVYKNEGRYLLEMLPTNTAMKKMFEKVLIILNKNTFDVVQLIMIENGGDRTVMNFKNIKHNTTLNEALFKIK